MRVSAESAGIMDPTLLDWAERLAATLPPLTASEAAAAGRIAAGLNARRADQDAAQRRDASGPAARAA